MADEPGWVPAGIDVRRANVARVYDYLLGGSHNFLADQDLGRSLVATDPSVRAIARASPGARVVYADIDPVAIAHSKAMLAGNQATAVIEAELRRPEKRGRAARCHGPRQLPRRRPRHR